MHECMCLSCTPQAIERVGCGTIYFPEFGLLVVLKNIGGDDKTVTCGDVLKVERGNPVVSKIYRTRFYTLSLKSGAHYVAIV